MLKPIPNFLTLSAFRITYLNSFFTGPSDLSWSFLSFFSLDIFSSNRTQKDNKRYREFEKIRIPEVFMSSFFMRSSKLIRLKKLQLLGDIQILLGGGGLWNSVTKFNREGRGFAKVKIFLIFLKPYFSVSACFERQI